MSTEQSVYFAVTNQHVLLIIITIITFSFISHNFKAVTHAKASACCFHTYAYLSLSSARWYPSSSRLVRASKVSPVFLYVFSFVGFSGGDKQCLSVISYPADVPCPGPLPSSDLFNHICDLCLFSYPHVCFSVPIVPIYDV